MGILAHVDAGKTTLAEQFLYHTHSIAKRGRVDHKNTFLDTHGIEKERGITVFSDEGIMEYNGSTYYLVDTPGHVDFSTEMERALQVMDYAVLVFSAVEGVESHTETVWKLLRKHSIPTFIFINKIDRTGADVKQVIKDIKNNLSRDICHFPFGEELEEPLKEFLAERDDFLLEAYMNDKKDQEIWIGRMMQMFQKNQIFLWMEGSALRDQGIKEFLKGIDQYTRTNYTMEGRFAGQVYKIRYDEQEIRLTHIKVNQGILKVRDEVSYGPEGNRVQEKITQIRVYSGNKYETVDQVTAGQLCAVMGLTQALVGDGVGESYKKIDYEITPTLQSKVSFEAGFNVKEVYRCFSILEAEDPALHLNWAEELQEIHIRVMGTIQLEVLQQAVKERFGLDVSFEEPEILYKETLQTGVVGVGHFEPLKHYAEVHLRMEPGERNSGICFFNACHADDLTTGHQNLIAHHIYEREHKGLLTGSPVTDLKITLLTGRAHNKHTGGGDFREATYRAIRQGLEKGENILLEPFYSFTIKVDMEHMGRVLSDVQKAAGKFEPPEITENKVIIVGRVPVATFMNYSTELAAFTQGKGLISLNFAGYDVCHNEEEIIERKGYKKDEDPQYTSASIFCSKGQGYTVPWYEVEEHMHCSSEYS